MSTAHRSHAESAKNGIQVILCRISKIFVHDAAGPTVNYFATATTECTIENPTAAVSELCTWKQQKQSHNLSCNFCSWSNPSIYGRQQRTLWRSISWECHSDTWPYHTRQSHFQVSISANNRKQKQSQNSTKIIKWRENNFTAVLVPSHTRQVHSINHTLHCQEIRNSIN